MVDLSYPFYVRVILSIECLLITAFLFKLYFKKVITTIELLLYSYACTTFVISFISNTVTPLFFVTTFFSISEVVLFLRSNLKVKFSLFLIIILPFFSTLFFFVAKLFGFDFFQGNGPSSFRIIINGLVFYIKYFLPLIFIASKIYREGKISGCGVEHFFSTIRRVALWSCFIALAQLIITIMIKDPNILRLFGMRDTYLSYTVDGMESKTVRVSAFFIEPKVFSAFLLVSLPLFLSLKRKILHLLFVLLIGFLTASQTFMLGIIISLVVFFLIRNIKNIRLNIGLTLSIILVSFYTISLLRNSFIDFYLKHSDNYIVSLIMARAVDRYGINSDILSESSVNWLPLQKDEELPVFNFFLENPWLYLSGYGLKNQGFIPLSYFIYNSEGSRHLGDMTYNLDMGWYYFICEFGIIIFIVWFIYFTRDFHFKKAKVFESKYYSFLIILFFFARIELFIILLYTYFFIQLYLERKNNLIAK